MSVDEVPHHEFMLFVLRVVVALCLVWLVGGTFGYLFIAERFGWDKSGGEANLAIFIGLSLACALIVAALAYAACVLTRPLWRKRPVRH